MNKTKLNQHGFRKQENSRSWSVKIMSVVYLWGFELISFIIIWKRRNENEVDISHIIREAISNSTYVQFSGWSSFKIPLYSKRVLMKKNGLMKKVLSITVNEGSGRFNDEEKKVCLWMD